MTEQDQSTLNVIYENWKAFNERLKTAVAPLKVEHFSLQPAPHMWPLGQILQHIISARAGWFSGTLQENDPRINDYMEWGQWESPARNAAEMVQGLEDTWAFIEGCLNRWTAVDRAMTFPDEWNGQIYQVSRNWVIYHVMEHDLYHGGEASLILGMNGLQGLDL